MCYAFRVGIRSPLCATMAPLPPPFGPTCFCPACSEYSTSLSVLRLPTLFDIWIWKIWIYVWVSHFCCSSLTISSRYLICRCATTVKASNAPSCVEAGETLSLDARHGAVLMMQDPRESRRRVLGGRGVRSYCSLNHTP